MTMRGRTTHRRAFTLLELIVVMTILSAVFAICSPQLSRFMRGRDVQEQIRRTLVLTRWARSEAISQGVRMEVWFDPEKNAYGIGPVVNDTTTAGAPSEEQQCDDRLSFEIDDGKLDKDGRAAIRYWPDGTLDVESLERVVFYEEDEEAATLALTENTLEYVFEDDGDDDGR